MQLQWGLLQNVTQLYNITAIAVMVQVLEQFDFFWLNGLRPDKKKIEPYASFVIRPTPVQNDVTRFP